MSRNAQIEAIFGDGPHTFRLGIKQLIELQEKTDCGPRLLLSRLQTGTWRIADLRETLRIGLIGGGMSPYDALSLVDRYAIEGWLIEAEAPAKLALMAALLGAPDEDEGVPGEPEGEATTGPSPTIKSNGPGTTSSAG
ncbi:gene transfer agent family protein [Asticcacaulis sp. ZE23SCel15]|uniref:gene transfer agent family protein n=1 Tax=Asticcacaulis sp. ZE23SCel15 TaxID=3059027 RepID=UPI00265E9168|nr:gene transfer agent family protein [Asticcacaulis sp. ZE23SCel15]WKL57237.1 gene transfer agent family protein [Asticcacaulis sp. ZE23SCel15]